MSEESNHYDHLSDDAPDGDLSKRGTASPSSSPMHPDVEVSDPIVALIERKVRDIELDVQHLNRVNIELLLTDLHELADQLGRLSSDLSAIRTVFDVKEIARLKRYDSQSAALEYIELRYSNAGMVANDGQSCITAIKNLMNRFQEKLRIVDNDNLG